MPCKTIDNHDSYQRSFVTFLAAKGGKKGGGKGGGKKGC